jgi:hypothetical protein
MKTLRMLIIALLVSGCATSRERRYFPEGSLSPPNARRLATMYANAGEPPLHEYTDSGSRRYRFALNLSIPQTVVVITVIDSGFGQVLRTRMLHVGGSCTYDQYKILSAEEFDSFVAAVEAVESSSPPNGFHPDVWSIFTVLDGSSYSLEVWSKDDGITPSKTRVYPVADPRFVKFDSHTPDLLKRIVPEATVDEAAMIAYASTFKTLIKQLEALTGFELN